MLFGHTYKCKFRLPDGRVGKATLEARFASANDIITEFKHRIAFEYDVFPSQVIILNII